MTWKAFLAVPLAALIIAETASAQDAIGRMNFLRGQIVSPSYEGWWPNDDGTYTLYFGYFNTNWEETYEIPVGPDNYFTLAEAGGADELEQDFYDAGEADQGQPAFFYPRRTAFLFTVTAPDDFAEKEWVWTLNSQGTTNRAFGLLAPDYRIDPQVMSTEVGGNFGSLDNRLRTNIPPDLEVEGDAERTVRVGEPLELVVYADDPDNYPPRSARSRAPETLDQLYRPPGGVVVQSGPGLRFSWMIYRGGEDHTVFNPVQMKTWMDSRVWANSPWSSPFIIPEPPEDRKWMTEVTFDEPGDYVLRGVASDGSHFSYQNVNVRVTPLVN